MMTKSLFRATAGCLLISSYLWAQGGEHKYALVAIPQNLNLNIAAGNGASAKDVWFDYDNAVLQQDHVLDLIDATTGRCAPSSAKKGDNSARPKLDKCPSGTEGPFSGKNDYLIFHIVNWDSSNSSLKVTKQNWYIYNIDPKWDSTYFEGSRIYGKKQLYLYTIHLNRPSNVIYEERYSIDEKHKTPAFLDHLVGIGQLFGIAPGGGARAPQLTDTWYAFPLDVKYVPADIQITPVMLIQPGSAASGDKQEPAKADQPKPPSSPTSLGPGPIEVPAGGPPTPAPLKPPASPTATPAASADGKPASPDNQQTTNVAVPSGGGTASGNVVTLDARTFDNEGKYHIDFSVAVPITKISELSYVQTTQGIAPAKVDKQKIFALFDFYPVSVDIKNAVLPKVPYLLTGVALGSQPLKKALFGVGWGPIYANFYAAMLLNTQKAPITWNCGDKVPISTTGMTLANRSCPEFSFGLNMAVGAIADALKNKASSQSSSPSGSGGKK